MKAKTKWEGFGRFGCGCLTVLAVLLLLSPFVLLALITPTGVRFVMYLEQACADDTLGEAAKHVNEVMRKRGKDYEVCGIKGIENTQLSGKDDEFRLSICRKGGNYAVTYVNYFSDCEIMWPPELYAERPDGTH
jgi:hypothetical protein